jgi:two-component system response regulator YesN
MIGLLMVEDEEAIRQKLLHNVTWLEYGFEPVLGAGNGLEALEILKTNPTVQIMVTDVQMPKLNGIDLIKEVKRRGLPLKIVVISGFAEFEYAQESIKLNVADYLLKPFASRRLLEVVLRLKNEIQHEQAQQSELGRLREQLTKNRAALKEKLFMDLLSGNFIHSVLKAQFDFLGLTEMADREFQVIVIEIPENNLEAVEEAKYLLNMQFFSLIKKLLAAGPYDHLTINYRRNQVVTIIFEPDPELPLRLEELSAQIRLQLNQSLACGVGHPYRELTDLSVSYQEACSAWQYRYLYGLNRVFSIDDLNFDKTAYHKLFYQLHQNPLFNDLKIGVDSAIQADLKQLIAEIRAARLKPELARIVVGNLVLLAFTTLNELGYKPAEILGGDFSILGTINQAETLEELENLLLDFFAQLNTCVHQKRTSVNQKLITAIRLLLDEHYQQDLSLSAIANQYQISPGYLSVLLL